MATLMVTYSGDTSDRFDRDRYTAHHIPLVTRTWRQYGLHGVEVYYASEPRTAAGVIAVCLCHFTNREDIDRALAAPESAAVMADVSTITGLTPARTVMDGAAAETW